MKPLIIIALFFSAMVNAQIVNIPDANFKAELIAQSFDLNADGEIQLSEAQARNYLEINTNPSIASLEGIQSFTTLTDLRLVDMPLLNSLDISNLINLQYLTLRGLPQLTSFNSLPNLPQLYSLSISNLPATTLDFSNLTGLYGISVILMPSLTSLTVAGNTSIVNLSVMSSPALGALDVSGCTGLVTLSIDNASYASEMIFNSVNLTGCNALKSLSIDKTSLASLDVSPCVALENFYYEDNHVPNVDLSGLDNLLTARVSTNAGGTYLRSVNVNGCIALNSLHVGFNDLLDTVYMKNGRNETFFISGSPNLKYVCADDSQVAAIQTQLNSIGGICTSYCSFTPGGNYNTITGNLTFDANNNGCDSGDAIQPNIKISLGSPVVGSTFTNASGNYTFYTDAGSFQWTPAMENQSWFTIAPTPGTHTFADNNNNSYTQNFCLSANGSHNDLEVVISPIGNARPGFASSYKIVFKNKGNQTLSGNVGLTFDDSRLDFLSAAPAATTLATNSLTWTYTNLLPFESRVIFAVFDVNSPSDTPAVNNGDVLHFDTSITPITGDDLPMDNTFSHNQIVVGSLDPNSIRCLEGPVVSPSQIGDYLHYAVTFENTGTFQAENVVVKDIIDTSKYDINSLQLLSTSHPCYTRITGNVVEFIFENINLAAVSGNPPVGGHGDVLFKIKSQNTLVTGDQVAKSGKIYFDYNLPITTNIAQTTYQNLSNGLHHLDNSISIYPNPTSSTLTIECDSVLQTIELYDIQGRLLESDFNNAGNVVFDMGAQQNGIYFLKIKSEKGSKVEKVVKE